MPGRAGGDQLFENFQIISALTPLKVPVPGIGELDVIAFYAPGSGLTPMDRRTGGAPFANFWPLAPHTITVVHNGISGDRDRDYSFS